MDWHRSKCSCSNSVSSRQLSTPLDRVRSTTLQLASKKVSDEQDPITRSVGYGCDGKSGGLCSCGPDCRTPEFSPDARRLSHLPGTVPMALSVGRRVADCFEASVRRGLDRDASSLRAALLRPLPAVSSLSWAQRQGLFCDSSASHLRAGWTWPISIRSAALVQFEHKFLTHDQDSRMIHSHSRAMAFVLALEHDFGYPSRLRKKGLVV